MVLTRIDLIFFGAYRQGPSACVYALLAIGWLFIAENWSTENGQNRVFYRPTRVKWDYLPRCGSLDNSQQLAQHFAHRLSERHAERSAEFTQYRVHQRRCDQL